MSTIGPHLLRPASSHAFHILRLICLAPCLLLAVDPGVFGSAAGQTEQRGIVVPPKTVQVPDLRRRPLLEAQQLAKDTRLRLEVSGGWPEDPSRAIVVEQKPGPKTEVAAGSSVAVVVPGAGAVAGDDAATGTGGGAATR